MAEPDTPRLLEGAAARAISYLTGLDARAVAPDPAAVAALARFDEPLPSAPSDPEAIFATCCRHARRFAAGLGEAGCEILNDVVLNQVLVSFGDADTTRRIIEGIQQDGTCWCGVTEWHGRVAMRISVSSWATADADVEVSLAAMLRVARARGALT